MPVFHRTLLAAALLVSATALHAQPRNWTPAVQVEKTADQARLLNAKGKVLLEQLDGFYPEGDVALVSRGSLWGAVRADGKVLLQPEYARVDRMDGTSLLQACREDNESCGLVDHNGKVVLPLQNERLAVFDAKRTPWSITREDRTGAYDPKAQRWALPQEYAQLRIGGGFVLARSAKDGDWQVFDEGGKPVPGVPAASDWTPWAEGERVVGSQGVFDTQGRAWVSPGRYSEISGSGQSAVVQGERGFGLIDAQGNERVVPQYQLIEPLQSEHEGWLRFVEGESWDERRVGVMDAQGKVLLPARWDGIDLDLADGPAGKDSQLIFRVLKEGRIGALDAGGRELFPAKFESASALDYGSVLYQVSEGERTGVCDFTTGKCPVPVRFDRVFEYDGGQEPLFVVSLDGRYGLMDAKGNAVTPLKYEKVEESDAGRGRNGGVRFTVTEKGKRQPLQVQWSAGAWHVSTEPVETTVLHAPYDGHPMASLIRPVIEARYLPADLNDDAAISRAYAEGQLREAQYPSIQLSGSQAYALFELFPQADRAAHRLSLPHCRQPDGFRLLISRAADASACAEPASAGLSFTDAGDGSVICKECAELKLPVRWVRADPPPRCTVPAWSQREAQQAYMKWLTAFTAAMQPLKKGASKEQWKAEAENLRGSLVVQSRATAMLVGLTTNPESFAKAMQVDAAQLGDDLLPRLLTLLASAEVVGSGGLYPENEPGLADACAEVWYLRLPALELRKTQGKSLPFTSGYQLPPSGELQRDRYPFATFTREDGVLKLVGLSRELAQALLVVDGD